MEEVSDISLKKESLEGQHFLIEELLWIDKYFHDFIQSEELIADNDEKIYPKIRSTPPTVDGDSYYALFIQKNQLSDLERLALGLALVPHTMPHLLYPLIQSSSSVKLGIFLDKIYRLYIPTGRTLMHLWTGGDFQLYSEVMDLFENDHLFAKEQVLSLSPVEGGKPVLCGELRLSEEFVALVVSGKPIQPKFNQFFPAQLLTTSQHWDNLILPKYTKDQIHKILDWIHFGEELLTMPAMQKVIKRGYRALFFGPPGTGKSMTAALLGKLTNKEVYRVDLSMVVSKYIGETEKNLSNVFAKAESKGWILFFDEADALFGKRTQQNNSHDRYANQEVSYLLQRIENYDGVIILASNMRENMDQAFTRRFQSMIYFPMPKAKERHGIWQNCFSGKIKTDKQVDLLEIAKTYELAGGVIINVVRDCAMTAIKRGDYLVSKIDIETSIRHELAKENKSI